MFVIGVYRLKYSVQQYIGLVYTLITPGEPPLVAAAFHVVTAFFLSRYCWYEYHTYILLYI